MRLPHRNFSCPQKSMTNRTDLPSSQVPKVSQGQSLSVQQQHFHVTFARRMGLNYSNLLSFSQFTRSSDEERVHRAPVLSGCIGHSQPLFEAMQGSKPSILQTSAALFWRQSSVECRSVISNSDGLNIGLHDQDVASHCDSEAQAAALGFPTEDF